MNERNLVLRIGSRPIAFVREVNGARFSSIAIGNNLLSLAAKHAGRGITLRKAAAGL